MRIMLVCRNGTAQAIKRMLEKRFNGRSVDINYVDSHEEADLVLLEPKLWTNDSFCFEKEKSYIVISCSDEHDNVKDDIPRDIPRFSPVWLDRLLPDYVEAMLGKEGESKLETQS